MLLGEMIPTLEDTTADHTPTLAFGKNYIPYVTEVIRLCVRYAMCSWINGIMPPLLKYFIVTSLWFAGVYSRLPEHRILSVYNTYIQHSAPFVIRWSREVDLHGGPHTRKPRYPWTHVHQVYIDSPIYVRRDTEWIYTFALNPVPCTDCDISQNLSLYHCD